VTNLAARPIRAGTLTCLLLAAAAAAACLPVGRLAAAQPVTPAPAVGEGPRPTASVSARPRIGLALSGGGARGFAHVGVLRALETLRVPIDCIAGTSAGSAVGAAYASGLSPDDIERALRSADWDRDIFDDEPPRRAQQSRRKNAEKSFLLDLTVGLRDGAVRMPPGLVSGQKIELFLHRMLGASAALGSFDLLPIPFRAIATDIEIGEMVVQDRGSLVTAVRASMAVPSVFAPVSSGGRLLVDGGLTRNMPVDVVRLLCADVVIAIDIGSPLLGREALDNAFGVAAQMVNVLMERNMRDSRAEIRPGVDVMIRPDLGAVGAGSFAQGVAGIEPGERATLAASGALQRLALAPAAYDAWQADRQSRRVRNDRFTAVRVIGTDESTGRALLAQAGLPTTGELDRTRLERVIGEWNATGDFDRIGYSLLPEGAGQDLVVEVVERGWGPNFLRFGLGAAADSKQNGVFDVLFGFRRPRLNASGGEFKVEYQFGTVTRLSAEFFQPFNRGAIRAFVTPKLLVEEVPRWLFLGDRRVAEYGIDTRQVGLDVGVQGWLGEARLGAFTGRRSLEPRIASTFFPELESDFRGLQLSMRIDQLDATDFPREGYLLGLAVRAEETRETGRPRERVELAQLVGRQVASWGPHTVAAGVRLGEVSEAANLAHLYSLGGFMNLSGLQLNQLQGRSLRYASLSYQNQVFTLPNPLGRGVYAGFALEAGRLREQPFGLDEGDWKTGVTGYLGAHTAIGPVYLGYGVASGNNRLFYLYLGRPGL